MMRLSQGPCSSRRLASSRPDSSLWRDSHQVSFGTAQAGGLRQASSRYLMKHPAPEGVPLTTIRKRCR